MLCLWLATQALELSRHRAAVRTPPIASRKAATGITKNRSDVVVAIRLLVYVGSLDTACERGCFVRPLTVRRGLR